MAKGTSHHPVLGSREASSEGLGVFGAGRGAARELLTASSRVTGFCQPSQAEEAPAKPGRASLPEPRG